MREIKFRGRKINDDKWVYGDLIQNRLRGKWIEYRKDEKKYLTKTILGTVGQYTGLKDKNGIKIYEGDIVKYTFDIPNSPLATENGLKVRIAEVFWCEWRSSFAVYGDKNNKLLSEDLFRYVRNGNTVEIVGNIYENSELIKEIK